MRKQISKQSLFPTKLSEILNEMNEYIRWGQDGITIQISDIRTFESNVLSLYFRHHNYESFTRQMNLYGFKKSRGSSLQIFTNPQIKNGKKYFFQLRSITDLQSRNQKRRQKLKKNSLRRKYIQKSKNKICEEQKEPIPLNTSFQKRFVSPTQNQSDMASVFCPNEKTTFPKWIMFGNTFMFFPQQENQLGFMVPYNWSFDLYKN